MIERGPCATATSIEEKQPWVTLPGWTCLWKRPRSASRRQAKAAMGAMPNKTDRNDARGIAQIMRTGWYRAVHVKSPSCRSWRALLTARRMVLNKRRDVENGVRALLREAGLKVGTPSRKDFPARVRELAAGDAVLAGLAESLLSIIEAMTGEVA